MIIPEILKTYLAGEYNKTIPFPLDIVTAGVRLIKKKNEIMTKIFQTYEKPHNTIYSTFLLYLPHFIYISCKCIYLPLLTLPTSFKYSYLPLQIGLTCCRCQFSVCCTFSLILMLILFYAII